MKTTIIKGETVKEAMRIYGENTVNEMFELIKSKLPAEVMKDLEDPNKRACLLYLFSGNLNI